MMRRKMFVALVLVPACGGTPPPKSSPDPAAASTADVAAAPDPEPAGPTPAEKCLADANAEIPAPIAIPSDVTVSHVLVKHVDAKQAEGIERSREEACLRAEEALASMKKGMGFEEAVAAFSDSKGAETTGGLIGKVKKGDLGDDRLQEAAFALSVNQVSNVVESSFGFHIILRTR